MEPLTEKEYQSLIEQLYKWAGGRAEDYRRLARSDHSTDAWENRVATLRGVREMMRRLFPGLPVEDIDQL